MHLTNRTSRYSCYKNYIQLKYNIVVTLTKQKASVAKPVATLRQLCFYSAADPTARLQQCIFNMQMNHAAGLLQLCRKLAAR